MTMHVSVTVWYEDEGAEDNFDYYGPLPSIGDMFIIDYEGREEEKQTSAPDGVYMVQRRTFHHPARGWQILITEIVDEGEEPEQTTDESEEETDVE